MTVEVAVHCVGDGSQEVWQIFREWFHKEGEQALLDAVVKARKQGLTKETDLHIRLSGVIKI
jgi:hypothetical protein